ncbi:MAG: DNA translocase FtsK 4TM domain-containing protein [Clostridium sp.]|nr:DNA translocase FtsK 4TM domain-containing protein [Clostridium sp.]
MPVHEMRDEMRQQIKAVFILALAVLGFAALLFPRQTGEVGSFFNNVLRMLTGEMALVVPVLLVANGIQSILPWKIPKLKQRIGGILLFFLILLVYAHLASMAQKVELVLDNGIFRASLQVGLAQQGGGVIGALLSVLLYFLFRDLGSKIILGAALIIAFLLVTNISLTQLLQTAYKIVSFCAGLVYRGCKAIGLFFRHVFSSEQTEEEAEDEEAAAEALVPGKGKKKAKQEFLVENDKQIEEKHTPQLASVIRFPQREQETVSAGSTFSGLPENSDNPLVVDVKEKETAAIAKQPAESDYCLPPLTLLAKVPKHKDSQQAKNIAERTKILERTLESFGVKVRVTAVQTGPTVTRFEIQPEIGVKVAKIVSLADDLALNLAASGVRIEAPIPGKAAVGIEVPNKVIAPVYLLEVLEDEQFTRANSPLTIALGKDITGTPILADLMKMPHLLIAGSTGSGKSVCINVLIASILFKARPEDVKFVMIDPKVVELNVFNGIPHLLMPVVTEPKKASLALRSMLKEMGIRYELFAKENVRDINSYNERKRLQNQEQAKLPYIVVIIDELADLMMVAAVDVEDSIARLAQMSRAAGIHLVIATQRPSVDVITGVIKANITSRIAFAVSAQVDSRTILDVGGAEKLLGRGDALFHPIGAAKPFRIQGAFINERELTGLLEFIKDQGGQQFTETLFPEEEAEADFYEEDELFFEAVMLIAEAGTASISLLQRRLRIGYTRAARLIDDMERRCFVGRFEGSKAREVLITPDQARNLLSSGEAH